MQLAISPIGESTNSFVAVSYVSSKESRLYYYMCANPAPVHSGDLSVMALNVCGSSV
jgi:hypothetical protein